MTTRIVGIVVSVLVLLALPLLLGAAAAAQQTAPSIIAQDEGPPIEDDIQVKPRGGGKSAYADWTCGGYPCRSGNKKALRDDLLESLTYLTVNGKDLDGMRFSVKKNLIEVRRDGSYFKWTSNAGPLNLKACTHGKSCKGNGIPGAWLKKIVNIEVLDKDSMTFRPLGEEESIVMRGKK